jgi:hypothetical protein
LVLVAAPTRLFARWLAYWAVRFVLFGVSARDEYGAMFGGDAQRCIR